MADIVDGAQKARAFKGAAGPWLQKLREVYKERLARSFEKVGPQTQVEVERLGAKIAVLDDLARELDELIANGDVAEREQEERQ